MNNEEQEDKRKKQEDKFKEIKKIVSKLEKRIEEQATLLKDIVAIYEEIQTINKAYKQKVLKQVTDKQQKRIYAEVTFDDLNSHVIKIIEILCARNKNEFKNIFSERNHAVNQKTRREIQYFLRRYFCILDNPHYVSRLGVKLTLHQIGAITGRDHASVLHSCGVVESETNLYKSYASYIKEVTEECDVFIAEAILKIEEAEREKRIKNL